MLYIYYHDLQAINPLQVRIAESQAERENKLFIGMLPKTIDEEDLHNMFAPYGELREVHIIRGPEGSSKGCAFVKFVDRDAAMVAIEDMVFITIYVDIDKYRCMYA
jgi:CUG-BP- and ETR3-like factor